MYSIIISLIEEILVYAPLVCGAYILFSLLKVPDLSLQSAFVTGGVCAGLILTQCTGPSTLIYALTASMAAGAGVSIGCALIHTLLRVPYLLAAIATLGACSALDLYLLNGAYLSLQTAPNMLAFAPLVSECPELGALALVTGTALIIMIAIGRSQVGACLAVLGVNTDFCSHYGISSTYLRLVGSCLAGALAGLSGFLFAQTNGFVELGMGTDLALLCICALMMGRLCTRQTRLVNIGVPLSGMALFCAIQHALLAMHFNARYLPAIQALIVLALATYLSQTRPSNAPHDQLGV